MERKKNWLFIGEADAGERSAILYIIIECCRRRGIDPLTNLRDVLTCLPLAANWNVHELTPENWLKARTSVLQAAASEIISIKASGYDIYEITRESSRALHVTLTVQLQCASGLIASHPRA